MAKKIIRFNKLRSRRSLGRLGGTTLAAITLGALTPPIVVDVPVEVVRGGTLPARDQVYLAIPRSYHLEGKLEVLLKSETELHGIPQKTEHQHRGELVLKLLSDSKVRLITSEEHYERLKERQPLSVDRVYSLTLVDGRGGEVVIDGVTEDNEVEALLYVMAILLDEE